MPLRADPRHAQRRASRADGTAGAARRGRVLVAEDDRDLAELVARTLRLAGHEVTLAHDGLRALELAVGGPFDALLTDLTMPGLTGEQLARLLRELRPGLPIVLMTASDEPPADGPWSSLVRKPFGLDVLVAAVESALVAGGC